MRYKLVMPKYEVTRRIFHFRVPIRLRNEPECMSPRQPDYVQAIPRNGVWMGRILGVGRNMIPRHGGFRATSSPVEAEL